MTFDELSLLPALLRAVRAEGYETPTPIQQKAIKPALEGRDVLGCAQTGTGKTAAFALPVLQQLAAIRPERARPVRALVLTPTRELASQVHERFVAYGRELGFRSTVLFGGVGQAPQERALRAGIDILVATPGRLLDLLSQRVASLEHVEFFVLDEADRMLDMGFLHDVRRVLAAMPRRRQTMLFSATMPPEIAKLANDILRDPVRVEATPVATTAEKVEQFVLFVDKADKRFLLAHLLKDAAVARALVFTRTKHGANRLTEWLSKGGTPADALHGNKSQSARERALLRFRNGESRLLVATDIAARGLDIDGVTHVINFDLPHEPESYVHRIGRTARAGASGVSFSFCDADERDDLRTIQRLIGQAIPVMDKHPFVPSFEPPPPPSANPNPRGRGGPQPQQRRPDGPPAPPSSGPSREAQGNPGGSQRRGPPGAGRPSGQGPRRPMGPPPPRR